MRLTAFILILFGLHLSAKTSSQTVTLSGTNLTLETVFTSIKKQTGYIALFDGDALKDAVKVSVHAVDQSLEDFLKEVFKAQPLQFTIKNTSIFISRRTTSSTETIPHLPLHLPDSLPRIKIRGTVMDVDGQLLAGATIRVKGKSGATTSNSQGAFELSAEAGSTFIISYAGYVTVEEKLRSSHSIVVKLEPNSLLEEAVVYNGYQKIQQKYLTGSVTSLRMDSIMQPGLNTIDKMLEGRVPGMIFMQNSGQAGAAPKLRIRGTNTYLGSREPLWVVDGIVRTNPIPIDPQRLNDPDFVNLLGNAISGLNPYDIEQIDVLKDATAAALYGVRAANGVIVITTKRGKPGPPVVNYNVTGTFTQRPRYSDKAVNMMNSRERIDVSREMIQKQLNLRGSGLEAYEKAIVAYYAGEIDYNTFKNRVDRAESYNTDWFKYAMRDVFSTNHTLSLSGGTSTAFYRASVGYQTEPGVIKKERNDRYTAMLNFVLNYKKLKIGFDIQLNKGDRSYTPAEIGVLNYVYGTSRAIPLYNDDGTPYFYSNINSDTRIFNFRDLKTMNIGNEMNHTGETISSSEYNASIDLSYEIAKGIQFNSKVAYTGGASSHDTWFGENTEWASKIRNTNTYSFDVATGTFRVDQDVMPFGGELRQETVRKQNYTLNARLDFSRYLDYRKKHQLTAALGTEITSLSNHTNNHISRGYYPNRGHSFADIDLSKYTAYANWLRSNGLPIIHQELQNSLRTFLTSTYVMNDRFVLSATTSQEFSNSFGSRSNEKFLPTWALSGRWNIYENLTDHPSWIDYAALKISYGTQGNMLIGQTPYTIIKKEALNTYYNGMSASIQSFPNPDLLWEKKHDYNISLEFSILNSRIRGSMGFFYSKILNAFLTKKVSAIYGAAGNSYVVNGGTLENQGVELDLHFRIINNAGTGSKKGFTWRFDPQLGQVFNKIINNTINSKNVIVDATSLNFQDFLNGSVPVNGKSVNTFYSYRFKTLDPELGFPVFYGAEPENKVALSTQYNKMTKEEVYSRVMVESGKREPVLQGGISNSFTYGNWALNVSFAYSLGNKVRLMQIASGNYGTFRPSSQQNLRKEFTQRWQYPGDEQFTTIPAIQGTPSGVIYQAHYPWWDIGTPTSLLSPIATDYYQMYDFSDIRVVKGDYLKLQNIALSYRLSNDLCKKLQCKGASVNVSGSNLFTLANNALRGQDAAQSGSAPNINLSIRPVYALNINISF